MKLNSFKFQDGKVFWLPKYPEELSKYLDDDYETRNLYSQNVTIALASAIEVAPEDEEKIRLKLWENKFSQMVSNSPYWIDFTYWQPEKDKVYSAECEMEVNEKKQQHLCKACKVDCIAALGKGTCKAPLIKVARLKPEPTLPSESQEQLWIEVAYDFSKVREYKDAYKTLQLKFHITRR